MTKKTRRPRLLSGNKCWSDGLFTIPELRRALKQPPKEFLKRLNRASYIYVIDNSRRTAFVIKSSQVV